MAVSVFEKGNLFGQWPCYSIACTTQGRNATLMPNNYEHRFHFGIYECAKERPKRNKKRIHLLEENEKT